MQDFSMKLLRLKEELKQREDQKVADMLGMTKAALSDRKRRDAFPEDKLFALKARRPELDLDVAYVMTGVRQPPHARASADALATAAGVDGGEDLNRFAADDMKAAAVRTARRKLRYEMLANMAHHCDDAHLNLLLQVAEAFSNATVLVAIRPAATTAAAGAGALPPPHQAPATAASVDRGTETAPRVVVHGRVGQHIDGDTHIVGQTITMGGDRERKPKG